MIDDTTETESVHVPKKKRPLLAYTPVKKDTVIASTVLALGAWGYLPLIGLTWVSVYLLSCAFLMMVAGVYFRKF